MSVQNLLLRHLRQGTLLIRLYIVNLRRFTKPKKLTVLRLLSLHYHLELTGIDHHPQLTLHPFYGETTRDPTHLLIPRLSINQLRRETTVGGMIFLPDSGRLTIGFGQTILAILLDMLSWRHR